MPSRLRLKLIWMRLSSRRSSTSYRHTYLPQQQSGGQAVQQREAANAELPCCGAWGQALDCMAHVRMHVLTRPQWSPLAVSDTCCHVLYSQ